MPQDSPLNTIAHVIQLSVAPVFLLTGVGAMLGVITNRLSRIIDRARLLEVRVSEVDPAQQDALHEELVMLSHRARLVNRSISLLTVCALLVCTVIAVLFLGTFFGADLSVLIAALFVLAMLAFISALLIFLREVYLATATLMIGPR
jgi:hypothetical protein